MIHMAVDAAITQKSHDMELMACFLGFVHGFKKHGILLKGSIFDGPSDARQVLIDNASGTNGQMTHFRVSHLPSRQANSFTAWLELTMGIAMEIEIQMGCLGFGRRVRR